MHISTYLGITSLLLFYFKELFECREVSYGQDDRYVERLGSKSEGSPSRSTPSQASVTDHPIRKRRWIMPSSDDSKLSQVCRTRFSLRGSTTLMVSRKAAQRCTSNLRVCARKTHTIGVTVVLNHWMCWLGVVFWIYHLQMRNIGLQMWLSTATLATVTVRSQSLRSYGAWGKQIAE